MDKETRIYKAHKIVWGEGGWNVYWGNIHKDGPYLTIGLAKKAINQWA